jgi:hypothetical protein
MRNLSDDKERALKAHFKALVELSIEELNEMSASGSRFKDIITSMGKMYHCEFTIKEIE